MNFVFCDKVIHQWMENKRQFLVVLKIRNLYPQVKPIAAVR